MTDKPKAIVIVPDGSLDTLKQDIANILQQTDAEIVVIGNEHISEHIPIPQRLEEEPFIIKNYRLEGLTITTTKNKHKGHQRPYKYHR